MVNPLKLNPVPLIPACEMVTLVPPVLVILSEAVCWVPTVTLPKPLLDGVADSCPGVIPVPVRAMVSTELGASEVNVTVPDAAPAAGGVNTIVNVVL